MADVVVAQRMWQRRDTPASWTAENPILAAGEIGVEIDPTVDPELVPAKCKIGDGVTRWADQPYFGGSGSTEIEFRANATHLQWRVVGDPTWIDIVALTVITGPAGPSGSSAPRVQLINSTPGGTAACNWSLYDDIRIKLTEASVTITFSGAVDGQVCRLKLVQDASGGRSVTVPPVVRYNDTYPSYDVSVGVNRADILQFRYDTAESSYDIFSVVKSLNTAGAVSEISTGITWTQSSVWGGLVATAGNMRDRNLSPASGAATCAATENSIGPEWFQANLGSPKPVSRVTVGGGDLPSWGGVASWLNGATIQYSLTGSSGWTTVAAVSGVTNTGTLDKDFDFPAVVAQYWRIARSGNLITATFKLYV